MGETSCGLGDTDGSTRNGSTRNAASRRARRRERFVVLGNLEWKMIQDDTSISTIVKSGNNMYNYYGQEGGIDVVESLLRDESDLKRSANCQSASIPSIFPLVRSCRLGGTS